MRNPLQIVLFPSNNGERERRQKRSSLLHAGAQRHCRRYRRLKVKAGAHAKAKTEEDKEDRRMLCIKF